MLQGVFEKDRVQPEASGRVRTELGHGGGGEQEGKRRQREEGG